MLSRDELNAVAEAAAYHGRQYVDSMGKTVYILYMEKGEVPDTDIVLGDGIQEWVAFVTDAHGDSPSISVQVVGSNA